MAVVNRKLILKRIYDSQFEGIATYTDASAGHLVGMDNAKVSAIGDELKGLIVDAQPTESGVIGHQVLRLAGKRSIVEDLELDGVAPGTIIYSDGDGTYSVTEPAGAAGTRVIEMGIVRRIDTQAADTGCEIELTFQSSEKGA